MAKDLARLIYNFPLLNDHIVQIPNQTIDLIYKINGFNNYSEFIYPINKDVYLRTDWRALPELNWDNPNRQLGALPIKLRALTRG